MPLILRSRGRQVSLNSRPAWSNTPDLNEKQGSCVGLAWPQGLTPISQLLLYSSLVASVSACSNNLFTHLPLYLKHTMLSFPWLLSPPLLVYSIGSPRGAVCMGCGVPCVRRGQRRTSLSCFVTSTLLLWWFLSEPGGWLEANKQQKHTCLPPPSEYITTPVLFCFSLTWVLGSKFRSSSFRSTCPQILSHLCSPHWRFPDMLLARLPSACTIAQPCWLLSLPLPNSCSMAFT